MSHSLSLGGVDEWSRSLCQHAASNKARTNLLARLMRDPATFVAADDTMPKVLEFAASHPQWPHPASVGVVDGMGVVVFAKPPVAGQ